MKNIKIFFKTQLAVAFVLLSASFSFAQVVTVPSNCTVVSTNIALGGVLGAGGKVTSGGVVSMPDALEVSPYTTNQGGIFTFNQPTGVTTASWGLKGDLSIDIIAGAISGVVGNYNNATQSTTGLQAKIWSYNKSYRPNSTETASPSWARSKGKITVGWNVGTCGSSMTFDVYKTFDKTPDIVGPTCLKPNTTYTYSVDRIVSDNTNDNIGFDSYYWSGIPNSLLTSGTFYTSADSSSITFTTGASVTPFTLQCCFGRVNPNTADGGISTVTNAVIGTHTTCIQKSLIVAPVPPSYVTGFAPPTCVATGTIAAPATFTISYPNVILPQVYTWTAANTGWVDGVTGSATTFTPVVNYPTSGTTTLTINTAGNNNPGELTLTITGSCDPMIFKYQINRNITAPLVIVPTGTTSTTNCIAGTSSGNTYTLSPTTSNSIVWSIGNLTPNTLTGISLQNATSSTVTVNTTGTATGSFTLYATSANATCNSTSVSTIINVQPAAPVFTAPNCVVKGTTVSSISVTPAGGAGTYSWTYPTGVTCTNCTTSNPTFVLNSAGTNVTLTATAVGVNSCNSPPVGRMINYIAVATNFQAGFPDQYLVNGACGTVNSWVVGTGPVGSQVFTTYTVTSGNVTITSVSGGTNNNLAISGSGGLPITSVCANLTGGITVCASAFGTFTQKQANNSINQPIKETFDNIIITPNPSSGNFNIKISGDIENASAVLTDFSGNEIQTYSLQKGDNKIEKDTLKKGTYFVVLRVDGKQETRQIIIK